MQAPPSNHDVVTHRIVWSSGTSRQDAEPDKAMEIAWNNLLSKVYKIIPRNQFRRKYLTLLFRNDIYDPSNSCWTVTLTASVEIA
jgi:hypothetical protein